MISGEFKALSRRSSDIERLRARLLSRTALCGVISLGILFSAYTRPVKADPRGTTVASGKVKITKSGTHTEFKQSSGTAILNHSSFDIRANESVNFQQPGANALAVNRVVGSDVSTSIAGRLTANGNVWVLNPSGVAISNTARINVNGLLATTAKISDRDILAGRASGSYAFSGAADGSAITNAGSITAGDGHVVLVAPVVENSGTITTNGSDIALGAGSGFTVDMELDGLTRFEVREGDAVSLTNTGTLSAEGGAVYLSAADASAVESAVVSIGGVVEATRIENRGGKIVISGGSNGVTEISGKIDASQTSGDGGQIVITGDLVDIKGTALIDASGAASGGKVEIGGGFQGRAVDSQVVRTASLTAPEGAPLPIAKRTAVREGAVIRANAGNVGDGGEIIVWADSLTEFGGFIEAKGGFEIGNGGFVEVSGKQTLHFAGLVDASAVNGAAGTLLLDPVDFTISTDPNSDNVINVTTLEGLLATTNVTINTTDGRDGGGTGAAPAGAGDITVADAVNPTVTVAGGTTLSLQAEQDVIVNASITDTGANALSVDINAVRNIDVNADIDVAGTIDLAAGSDVVTNPGMVPTTVTGDTAGSIDLLEGVTVRGGGGVALSVGSATGALIDTDGVAMNAGNISIVAGAGDIDLPTTDFDTENLVVDSAGGISDSGPITIANNIDLTAGGTVELSDPGNDFGGTVSVSAALQDVTLVDMNEIDVASATAASLSVRATNGIAAVETARLAASLAVPTLTLIDTAADGATAYFLQGAGATDNAAGTLNVDLLVDAGVTDLTFETTDAVPQISLNAIDAPLLDLSLATPNGVLVGSGTTNLQNLTVSLTGAIGDDIGATAPSLVVTGTTSLAATGNIIFDNSDSAHDFSTLVASSSGGRVEIDESNSISLGNIATNGLILDAGGAIDQITGTSIVATSTVDLTSDDDVTLGESDNDFQAAVAVDTTGDAVVLVDMDDILLGDIDGSSLSINAGGTVDQASGASITASDTVAVVATDSVTLDNSGNDFQSAISIDTTGDAIVLADTNAIVLGAIDGSSLGVTAGGSITDTDDQAISITGASTLSVTASGSDILLNDDGDTTNSELHTFVGLVTIGGDPGDVEIQTQGTLSVSGVTGADTVIFGAADDIVLGGAIGAMQTTLENNAGGTIDLGNDNGATTHISDATLDIAGDDVVIRGTSTILVDGASADGGQDVTLSTTAGPVRFENTASTFSGDLSVAAGGSVTQDVAITVSDDTSVLAADQNVDLSNTSNDFTGTVDVEGADVTLRDQSMITLGDVTVTGDLDVAVAAGDILDNGGNTISVAGMTSLAAADDIDLDNGTHTFGDAGVNAAAADRLVTLSADQITDFSASSGLVFGSVSASNAMDVDNLLQTSSMDGIEFTGTVSTGATSDLEIASAGDVTQSGGSITTDTLDLTAANSSVDFALDLPNDVNTLTAGAAPAISNSISFNDTDGITIGALSTGALSVAAGGTINDTTSPISVTGASTLTAVDGAGTNFFDVLIDEADTHDFGGSVFVTGEDVVLDDMSALVLGAVTTNSDASDDLSSDVLALTDPARFADLADNDGDLFVRSRGSITDTDGEVVTTSGLTTLLAQDGGDFFDIDLNETHAFSTTSVLNASGEQVRIATGTGGLAGTITADGGSDDPTLDVALSRSFLNATEFLAIEAGDIDLSGFDVSGAALNLPGGGALAIRGLSTVSSFSTLGASHVQLDSAGAGITLSGLSIAADTFTVSTSNSETGTVGSVFTEGDDITFVGANSIMGDLRAISGDDIVQTGGTLTVSGTTYLLAADSIVGNADQSIDVSQAGNDFQDTVDAIASGSITLRDTNDIDLGLVSAGFGETDTSGSGRDLTVTAGGTITQQSDAERQIFVRGDDDGTGTVDTDLDRAMSAGSLVDVLDSARVEAADAATFIAEEIVETVVIPGIFTLTSLNRSDVLLDNADNDFDRLSVSDPIAVDPVTARGEDIVLRDRDALALGNLTVAEGDTIIGDTSSDLLTGFPSLSGNDGDLVISAGGLVSQAAATAISVSDAVDITSSADITLDQSNSLGVVDLSGGTIILNEAGDVVLGSVSATNLSVSAGGTITDDGISATAADDVVVTGDTTLTSGGIIVLDDGFHDLSTVIASANSGASAFVLDESSDVTFGNVSASTISVDAGGGIDQIAGTSIDASTSVDLISLGNITLGGIDAPSLNVDAGGSITDDGTSASVANDVSVSGITTLTSGGDIILDDDFHELATVIASANSGASAFELDESSAVRFGNVSASTVSVDAGGGIDQIVGTSIDASTSVDLISLGNITLGGIDAPSLNVDAGGSITDDGASGSVANDVSVSGITTLTSGSDIILDDNFHEFATVIATADAGNAAFELDESTGVTFGNVAATTVSIDAAGTIDQLAGSSIDASSTADFTATESVTLGEVTNDFSSVVHVNTSSDAIVLADANDITLGGVDGSSLSVSAGGVILDDGVSASVADDISIAGVTTLTSGGDIILDDGNNELSTVIADANGGASALELVDSSGLILGDVAATTVSIAASGAIDQVTGSTITASDTVDIIATDSVTLGEATNDFQSVVHVDTSSDAIVLADANDITLGGIDGSSLSVSAGGVIIDDGVTASVADDISIAGITTLTSGGDIILDDDNHELATVIATANSGNSAFELDESSALTLGNIAATTVSIDAGGTIDQVVGSSVVASGFADFTSTADIALSEATNDFQAVVDASGVNILLYDADDIVLGGVDGTSLDVSVAGTITDDGVSGVGEDVSISGITTLTSGGDIVLDDDNHELATVIATANSGASAFELDESSALTLGNISASTVSIDAGGTIDQLAMTSIVATGDADFISVADISLVQTTNDFQAVVDASGVNIALYDVDGIILGGVDGTNLDVNAGGTITDDGVSASAADDVVITGDTTLVSGGAIILDDPNHDFNVVAGSANTGGSAFELESSSGVTFDNILASTVSVSAGGTIDQVTGSSIVATDTADFTSTVDITLDQATNDFQSTVDASGNAITLYDVDDIVLGGVDGASLDVNAGGTITDDGVSGAGEDVDIAGTTTLTSGGDIILDDDNHELATVIATANSGTSRFELDESTSLTLGNVAASTISIDAGGTIDQVAGSSVVASDTVDIIATDAVTLDQATNDFQSTVDVDTSEDAIVLVDANDLILGGVDGSSLSIAAGGTITDDGVSASVADDISISGITTLTSGGDIVLDDANNELATVIVTAGGGAAGFVLNESTELTLGNVRASNLDIDAGGMIDQLTGTSIIASGTADFTSTDDILLSQPTNDFQSSVALSGVALELVDVNSVTFDDVSGTTVSIDAGGTIDQVTGSSIVASDTVDITATDDVTLAQSGNDFQSTVDVDTSADSIMLRDANGIILGGIDGSSLNVRAGGTITDDGVSGAGEDVNITGVTTLTSGGDIILDDDSHEFDTVIASANSGSSDFELDESSAVTFGDVRASDISVGAGGAIDQVSGSAITALGNAEFTSPLDIRLNQTGNDFRGRVDAYGRAITLVDANSIRLGDIDAASNLTVRARSGSITDAGSSGSSAGGVDVAGVTSLSASSDITLDDLGNDFDSGDTGDGTLARVDATGQDIALVDEDAIILGNISADSLTVNAGGTITDTEDDAIVVAGRTSLSAQGSGSTVFDITLDNADLHDFGSSVSATGNNIRIDDNNNLILGTVDANGSLTILANGAINDTAGQAITIGGNALFNSGNGVQLLIDRVGGTVGVRGSENIVSVANGNFQLGNTTLTGDSVFDALSGNLIVTGGHSVTGGSLFLIAESGNVDMSGTPLASISGPVLRATESVAILAPNGSIVMPDDIGANSFQIVAGTDDPTPTFSTSDLTDASVSASLVNGVTNAVELEFARDLLITVPTGTGLPANGVLDIDTAGTAQFTMNATSNFAIGQAEFVNQVGSLAFDPLQFIGTLNDDQLLLGIDGDFSLLITGGTQTFNVQNTSSVIGSSNLGSGTIITGAITIEVRAGELVQFATFGEVANRDAQNAAIGTVTLINFTPNENSTINGCVIGAISSCTPLGAVILNLQFETGQFLGIAFVDPDEDEDDPFTNRGDEEEWE